VISLVAVTAALLLPTAAAASARCPGEEAAASAQSETALEQSLLCLINARRAAAGVRAVSPNGRLRAAALGHSHDMVRSGYFSHTAPGGVTFLDRILDSGYVGGARNWQVGENLVWGNGRLSSPAELVSSWMRSPPHRENLLRGRFREIGIAAVRGTPVAAGDDGGITVTSEYGFRGKRGAKKQSRRARR
jgi:uncharacterized protein YkwD